MGQSVSDSSRIEADLDTIFAVITDLEAYPEWVEGMLETEILSSNEDGRPHRARFRIDARIAEISYTLEYSYDDPNISWTLVEGEMVNQLDGAYDLTDVGDGRTDVRYSLEADVDMPVPGFLKKRAAKTILDQGLRGLKQRAENGG
jgi:ribosome-associated toxin RatA of RatAB toxin-antitoxin module